MLHKDIYKSEIRGQINSDSDIPRIRSHFQRLLIDSQREEGYIQVLDLDPCFSIEYKEEHWNFILTIYFIKVGKKKACRMEGVSSWKSLPRTIPQASLKK